MEMQLAGPVRPDGHCAERDEQQSAVGSVGQEES